MEVLVSGKLKTAAPDRPSFKGFVVEASFGLKPPRDGQFAEGSDAAEGSLSVRISAVSDAAGNFTLRFPGPHEICTQTVKFAVSLPSGRIVREVDVRTVDLGKEIAIDLEMLDARSSEQVTPSVATPQSVVVDALFKTDAALRRAITENLKPLRVESDAIAARVEKAWHFRPSRLSAEELARRHYVAHGSDPSEALRTAILRGVEALQSSNTERALTLRNTAELKRLVNNRESSDSLHGVVELGPLIEFIQRRGAGPIKRAELTESHYAAEAEAEAILGAIGDKDGAPVGRQQALGASALEAKALVKETVNKQMESATAPESPLAYSTIPNSADENEVQKTILDSFELRKGPTDVPSYHDFHTLQIAFDHVWTEIFDGQLVSLGRDLYSEYVKLKSFSGSTQPDLQVSTIADLKRLIEEIKKLSQFVQEDIPSSLRPEGGGQRTNDWVSVRPEDVARFGGAVTNGGVSLFIEWAFNELINAGNKPVRVTWNDFPLKLNEGQGNIIELRPAEKNVHPPAAVEIVLETEARSFKRKISFQQWDQDSQRPIYSADIHNFMGGSGPVNRMVLNVAQVQTGTLKFISEDEFANELLLGRYVLGDLGKRLEGGTRLTFWWRGKR